MNAPHVARKREELGRGGLQAVLEKRFICDYLQSKGYQWSDLNGLSKEEAKKLMTRACLYASLKLAEVESRAHFSEKIHGTS
jgi:hypothetical protein